MLTMYADTEYFPDMNAAAGKFVSSRVWGDGRQFGPHASMIVCEEPRKPVACVIYHNYDPHAGTIEISAASTTPRWLTRPVLDAMYRVAFEGLGCQLAFHQCDADKVKPISFHRRMGLAEHVIKRGSGRDLDLHVFTATDDQWRSGALSQWRKVR